MVKSPSLNCPLRQSCLYLLCEPFATLKLDRRELEFQVSGNFSWSLPFTLLTQPLGTLSLGVCVVSHRKLGHDWGYESSSGHSNINSSSHLCFRTLCCFPAAPCKYAVYYPSPPLGVCLSNSEIRTVSLSSWAGTRAHTKFLALSFKFYLGSQTRFLTQ